MRLSRPRAKQDEPPGVTAHKGGDLQDVTHERPFLQDEVIGGEHGHGRLRVAPVDPVNREKNAGGGASILRLD